MSHATRILESAGLANAAPKHGDIRVWWIPQIPGKPFTVDVGSARNPADLLFAKRLLTILAAYDFFQLENRIKPDFSNAGGLTAFDALMDAGTNGATGTTRTVGTSMRSRRTRFVPGSSGKATAGVF
jgi:hypothetical protein